MPVLTARDRTGSTANFVLEATAVSAIGVLPRPILLADTVLCANGISTLAAVVRNLSIEHHLTNLTVGARLIGAWNV